MEILIYFVVMFLYLITPAVILFIVAVKLWNEFMKHMYPDGEDDK